jgi:predicted nucleotidyltransferase
MKATDLVKSNVAYHNELNSKAWDNGQLRPEVRQRLLQIATIFIDYLDIPNFDALDIVLTGSIANYNYTRFSDFDLHVVTRYSDLRCDDVAEAFYRAKKEVWNNQHDIMIRGHEVELYVEDVEQPPVSGGVYSVVYDRWIKKPSYNPPRIDDRAVNDKANDLIQRITKAIASDDTADIERLRAKIRNMRRSGLDTAGEFGVENLAFKIVRNLGYLEKLSTAYTRQQDRDLSL